MKSKVVRFCLRFLRFWAAFIQVGNPFGKAPALIPDPDENEKLPVPPDSGNELAIWRLSNVLCSGLYGGAVISAQNRVYKRFTAFPWGTDLHPVLTSPFLGKRRRSIGKAVFLLTPEAQGNYYHWMVDLLPRLLFVMDNLGDVEERFIILHSSSRPYELHTLRLLNISQARVVRIAPSEIVHVKDLVVADYVPCGEMFPEWKKKLFGRFRRKKLEAVVAKSFGKVYLLRGQQKVRRIIGEEHLIELLWKKGFAIIDLQQLSLEEQMESLENAKIVVAPHGAALTNLVFCKEGTLVVELRSKTNPPEHFSEIAKTCNLRFETISLIPVRNRKKKHLANKENLLLDKQSIEELIEKLSVECCNGSNSILK
ncbi:glycosyltransferase family 61 protein [Nafulsella turpanensis]|uniref:glycosyltransferase family 61 protein n=1 Tax=Nafulsella turpanensis TaxID=1265690 RepID=UPI00034D061B|nr:glycosyltransferase family 61 protein [Nafulsella turpanensis]